MKNELDWIMRFIYSGRQSLVIDKSLIQRLGLNPSIVLTDLLQTYERFSTTHNPMIQKDGSFFYTIPSMKKNTGLSRRQQETSFRKLRVNKLIENWTTGDTIVEQRRWFKLDLENIKQFLCAYYDT